MLVAFPYTFQFSQPDKSSTPQRILAAFAETRGVSFLDLLPVYVEAMSLRGEAPEAFFLDKDHPTPRGHRLAARAIAQRIQREGWLSEPAR